MVDLEREREIDTHTEREREGQSLKEGKERRREIQLFCRFESFSVLKRNPFLKVSSSKRGVLNVNDTFASFAFPFFAFPRCFQAIKSMLLMVTN